MIGHDRHGGCGFESRPLTIPDPRMAFGRGSALLEGHGSVGFKLGRRHERIGHVVRGMDVSLLEVGSQCAYEDCTVHRASS